VRRVPSVLKYAQKIASVYKEVDKAKPLSAEQLDERLYDFNLAESVQDLLQILSDQESLLTLNNNNGGN
jgi:hypothetical protein